MVPSFFDIGASSGRRWRDGKGIQASSEIELNGKASGGIGKPAARAEDYIPENVSYTASYAVEGTTEIELLIRAANYDDPYNGGLLRSIRFGSQAAVDHVRWNSIGFQLVTFLILLLHGLYACIIYVFYPQERTLLIMGLLTLAVGVAVLIGHDNVLLLWLPINYTWAIKINEKKQMNPKSLKDMNEREGRYRHFEYKSPIAAIVRSRLVDCQYAE